MVSNLERLYKELNFIDKKEFIRFSSSNDDSFNNVSLRYKNAIKEMMPEAMFCLENEPFILFFNLEKNKNCEKELIKIHKQAWNFDKAPVIVISTSNDITFYNAFNFDSATSKLDILTNKQDDFQNFAYENLYTGKIFDNYENNFKSKLRVQDLLFKQIVDYRTQLINDNINPSLANLLLSRIIFIKYLKDRNIKIDEKDNNRIIDGFKNKQNLYNLFKYLKQEFNGDLFDITDNEELYISDKNMDTIKAFFADKDISGQERLFIPFDFSIIPIELISSIYEKFLNEQQYENKAYYTPSFIVDYITNQTIKEYLFNKNKKDSNCKVLDPACGSGIFLIETLRKIIQKEESLCNGKRIKADSLKKLVEDNIFGIDKDKDAINIAIFSLYITLLDYQDPRSILTFKFPHLKDKNFFVANFFDIKHDFNKKLKQFDFILSNPPYGEINDKYQINWFKNNKIPINDKQIAQSFLVRAKDFCYKKTLVSMIVLSKILYNVKAKKFRKYFLENFSLNEVLEMSSVRKLIFKNAIAPVVILNYSYNPDKKENLKNKFIHYALKPNLFFKYFNVIIIEKYDIKTVLQELVYKNDWLWKTLLFGNILDFHFIKRIITRYKTINSRKCEIIKGKGIQFGGGDKETTQHIKGLPFLDTKNKQLKRFNIQLDKNNQFIDDYVHRSRYSIKEIFDAPTLLIKKGCNSDFQCVSAVLKERAVFTDSIGSIKFKDGNNDKLYSLCGILNSDFFTYFILNYISAVTIERNQMHFKECLEVPYVFDKNLANIVKNLHEIFDNDKKILSNKTYEIEQKEAQLLATLNEEVANLYQLSDTEKDLIDYTLNISIPLWKYGDNISLSTTPVALKNVKEEQLKDYCNIFIEEFEEHYRYFNIDIYYMKYCTLINFKARENKASEPQIQIIKDAKIDNVLKSICNCAITDISDDIYIKKDVKGFNENSFYILKTNEYKNWHKAIARLDVNEFSNAIWEAELELTK